MPQPTRIGEVVSESELVPIGGEVSEADLGEEVAQSRSLMDRLTDPNESVPAALVHTGIGMAKGVGRTAVGLGRLVHQIPGVSRVLGDFPADAEAQLGLEPTNTPQKIGMFAEQAGEYLLPSAQAEKVAATVASKAVPLLAKAPRAVQVAGNLAPRMATSAASSAAVTAAQGGDPEVGAVLGAVGPVVGAAAAKAAKTVGTLAEPLVRAAIKPTVTAMRRVAGASVTGLDAKANELVRFIIKEGVTTAEKARTITREAELELQRTLAGANATTDAPQRAIRYLSALERSAAKQGLPAEDVATLRNAAAEVLESGLGKDVVTMVPQPHPTLVGPNGQPITVLVPQTTRALRTDVMADEALERARASGKWGNRKQWGEQKGAQVEASKAVERAERDSMKDAVPATRPILARQGKAIRSAEVLDRMEFRQANRDTVGLPAHVIAAGELARGKVPILAFAANWLRNNQMKAGIWADRLGKALQRNDVKEVSLILNRLGVGATAQATKP